LLDDYQPLEKVRISSDKFALKNLRKPQILPKKRERGVFLSNYCKWLIEWELRGNRKPLELAYGIRCQKLEKPSFEVRRNANIC
jgi:hypothetical protein